MVITLLYSTAFYSSDGEALDSLTTLSSRQMGEIYIISESECIQSIYGEFVVGEMCRVASFARLGIIYDIQLRPVPNQIRSIL